MHHTTAPSIYGLTIFVNTEEAAAEISSTPTKAKRTKTKMTPTGTARRILLTATDVHPVGTRRR